MLPSYSQSLLPGGLPKPPHSNYLRPINSPVPELSIEHEFTSRHTNDGASGSIHNTSPDNVVSSCGTCHLWTRASSGEYSSSENSYSSLSLQGNQVQWNSVWNFVSSRRPTKGEESKTNYTCRGSKIFSYDPLSSSASSEMPAPSGQLCRGVAGSSNSQSNISSLPQNLDQEGKTPYSSCGIRTYSLLSGLLPNEQLPCISGAGCGDLGPFNTEIMEAFAQDAPNMTFRPWDELDLEDLTEDIPFLSKQLIIPLPSPEDCLLLLNERGQLLMYIRDMSVVYLVGDTLEEGWRRFLWGGNGNWPLVLNRMDSDSGELLNDAMGMNVGTSCLVLTPSHYPTDAELMTHVKRSVEEMPFVYEKEIAIERIKAELKKIKCRKYVCISLIISNMGFVQISETWETKDDEQRVRELLQNYKRD